MLVDGLVPSAASPRAANIQDDVGASVEALSMLGLVEDHDRVISSITAGYTALRSCGRDGEPFIQLPGSLISPLELIRILDSADYSGTTHRPTVVNSNLWVPEATRGSYSVSELDELADMADLRLEPHSRLAVHNPDPGEEAPLLHFRELSFDGLDDGAILDFDIINRRPRIPTQLNAIKDSVATYSAEGQFEFTMAPLNLMGLLMITLIRRIKGEEPPLPTSNHIFDGSLRRRIIDQRACVGYVSFVGSQMFLDETTSTGFSRIGVGLTVG